MWFCPVDGTLLLVEKDRLESGGQHTFYCSTCPYTCAILADRHHDGATTTTPSDGGGGGGCPRQSVTTVTARRKQVDDILGGAAAWDNVDRTMAVCPACHHPEAYFLQMQIRSADEPMSVFYKCTACGHQWNDK